MVQILCRNPSVEFKAKVKEAKVKEVHIHNWPQWPIIHMSMSIHCIVSQPYSVTLHACTLYSVVAILKSQGRREALCCWQAKLSHLGTGLVAEKLDAERAGAEWGRSMLLAGGRLLSPSLSPKFSPKAPKKGRARAARAQSSAALRRAPGSQGRPLSGLVQSKVRKPLVVSG